MQSHMIPFRRFDNKLGPVKCSHIRNIWDAIVGEGDGTALLIKFCRKRERKSFVYLYGLVLRFRNEIRRGIAHI
jgi:hypothetical protein